MTDLNCTERLNQLINENNKLQEKIRLLLQEISSKNVYLIELEKKILDLEFQLHQTNLINPINLNYKEKYKRMLSVFSQVKEYKEFCLENKINFSENNSFTKLIEFLEAKKCENENELINKLSDELAIKENLIENLNKILIKNEQNFTEKTEQMKNQINYLIGLLNTKSEEDKNKKLLEVIKVLTIKNNELIGKDENKHLKEELNRKEGLIDLLTRNVNELQNLKKINEELKLINENTLVYAREKELNLKNALIDLELKDRSINLLEEKIKHISLENDTLSFRNRSLLNISDEINEKEKELHKKENELLKKEMEVERNESKIVKSKRKLKIKN